MSEQSSYSSIERTLPNGETIEIEVPITVEWDGEGFHVTAEEKGTCEGVTYTLTEAEIFEIESTVDAQEVFCQEEDNAFWRAEDLR